MVSTFEGREGYWSTSYKYITLERKVEQSSMHTKEKSASTKYI